jgi:hypothetical protein
MNYRKLIAQTILFGWILIFLIGCSAPLPSFTPTLTSPPTATPTQTYTPTQTETPTSTATPAPPTPTPLIPKSFEDVPNVEKTLIQNLGSEEISSRFNIPDLMPTTGITEGGVVFSEGKDGKTVITTEFPGDIITFGGLGIGFTLNEPLEVEGKIMIQEEAFNVTIHRFRNKVAVDSGYVFIGEGDNLNLLTFVRILNVGYIFLRGKGQVIFPNGDMVKLGY